MALVGGGGTTHAFKDFLRNPELLKDCKVVIWLVCNSSLKNPWPLPQRIQEAGTTFTGGTVRRSLTDQRVPLFNRRRFR